MPGFGFGFGVSGLRGERGGGGATGNPEEPGLVNTARRSTRIETSAAPAFQLERRESSHGFCQQTLAGQASFGFGCIAVSNFKAGRYGPTPSFVQDH